MILRRIEVKNKDGKWIGPIRDVWGIDYNLPKTRDDIQEALRLVTPFVRFKRPDNKSALFWFTEEGWELAGKAMLDAILNDLGRKSGRVRVRQRSRHKTTTLYEDAHQKVLAIRQAA